MEDTFKRKRIIIIVLVVILALVSAFFGYKALNKDSESEKDKEKEVIKESSTPILYEVTKEGSNNKMYLFGSIHVSNKNGLEFPKYLLDAYNNSHYIACEFDIIKYLEDDEKVMEDALKLLYDDGTTIKDHLSEETYTKLVNLLTEKEAYAQMFENYKPAFFESYLTNLLANDAELDADTGIDNVFLKMAKEDNKNILEVESYDYQLAILDSFSDELYDLLLSEAVDSYEESIEDMKKMFAAWKEGNLEDLERYASEEVDIEDRYTKNQIKEIKEYNKKLIYDRNDTMTQKAIEYFDSDKDVFYMVGSFHIIGEKGMAKQLESKGFTVKRVN